MGYTGLHLHAQCFEVAGNDPGGAEFPVGQIPDAGGNRAAMRTTCSDTSLLRLLMVSSGNGSAKTNGFDKKHNRNKAENLLFEYFIQGSLRYLIGARSLSG